ncbi:bifunctional (p)ppGpp synthetase/guanosine-3',5'-bis(diphosphate) 3'-pyrophosphohydrolase [Candidatus Saccharibacteria bacterium HGW-Saccharibacteria-1]|jgi:GTP pyrophosphokinase|nr:MAG: bifunctional (p)ppGpp synthetase/guanosine-3',5'-bis(diphosphate) 3'-pyrophosphohydrolase [Candidatus Saccharibacteria bacterium HGW-Saccharibacteria-1]
MSYNNTIKRLKLLENAKPYYSEKQLASIEHAIDFASKAHAGQKRASGEPYISHPLSVADILVDWGMDIDSVLAGILHDTIEDTETLDADIEKLFGKDVAFLVNGVTKVSKARSGMRNLDNYLPQTKDNLSKLLIAVGQDIRVIIIKLADRQHNLSTLQYLPKKKQQKIARESLEVFAPMADRLGMGRVRMQIEELAFSYLDPVEFKKLKILMRKRLGKSTRKLGEVRVQVETELKKHNIKFEVNGRVKSVYSLHKKLQKVDGNIDNIYDLMALRVIVDKKEDCYLVLGILHSLYQPMISRIKDYISTPKPNGYQSLHTTVITPNEQIVEFQIRTQEMHEYAERGLAANFHYNEQKTTKDYIKSKKSSTLPANMQWITQLQSVVTKLKQDEKISKDQLNVDLFVDRIFVYSPKGDIYNLPEGALPLDFAYLVHSDIAKHTYGFRVNNKIHPFDKPLQNGDVIEIITRKLSLPKQAWQEMVTTTHARNKLRGQLRQIGVIGIITNATSIMRRKSDRKKEKEENAIKK